MCRLKAEGKERCGCDSSEARRLRFGVSLAKRVYNALTIRPPKPNFLTPLEGQDSPTVENMKEEISRLHSFVYTGFRTNENLIRQDRRLNTIGAGIEHLSITKYGSPTDEQLVEAERVSASDFKLSQTEAKMAYENYKSELVEAGKTDEEAHEEATVRVRNELAPESHKKLCLLLEKRNEALRNALADVGVQFTDPETLIVSPLSDLEAVEGLKTALPFYPQAWIDLSNKHSNEMPFEVTKSLDRGHYYENYENDSPVAELAIKKDSRFLVGGDMTSNATHEFAHRVGDLVPSVNLSERTFLMRRAGHIALPRPDGSVPKPEKLSKIDSSKTELGYRDNFPIHYMGKVYGDGSLGGELFSTGMEALFTGRFGGLSGMAGYSADPDYKRFILGMIASSAKK